MYRLSIKLGKPLVAPESKNFFEKLSDANARLNAKLRFGGPEAIYVKTVHEAAEACFKEILRQTKSMTTKGFYFALFIAGSVFVWCHSIIPRFVMPLLSLIGESDLPGNFH